MIKSVFALTTILILLLGTIPSQAFAFTIVDFDHPRDNSEWVKHIEHGPYKAIAKAKLTTFDSNTSFLTSSGEYSGVAKLILKNGPTYLCTGTLLNDQLHILTAAHCVTSSQTGAITLKSGSYAEFTNSDGSKTRYSIDASSTSVPASWNADFLKGNDLAILKLTQPVSGITGYAVDSNPLDDLNNEVQKVGFGRSGTGDTGDSLSSGTKRDGSNRYDSTHDLMMSDLGYSYVSGAVLQYDFDNGNSANDAFGVFYPTLADTSTFNGKEVNSASGDSGGPTFNSDGEITGVTSYGIRLSFNNGTSSDINSGLDSSFGEFSGDTRVAYSNNLNFILSIVPGAANSIASNNSPPNAADDGTINGPIVTTTEDQSAVTPDVLANDTDPDFDILSVNYWDSTSNYGAKITYNGNGQFTYDPVLSSTLNALNDGNTLVDSFVYGISDGNGGTDTATVYIGVSGVTDPVLPGPSSLKVVFQNDHDDNLNSVNTVYSNRETMHIFATVSDENNQPVAGASVIVKLLGPNGKVGEFVDPYITDANGVIHLHYKIQEKRLGTGDGKIFGDASFNSISVNCLSSDNCSSSFTISSSSKGGKSQNH